MQKGSTTARWRLSTAWIVRRLAGGLYDGSEACRGLRRLVGAVNCSAPVAFDGSEEACRCCAPVAFDGSEEACRSCRRLSRCERLSVLLLKCNDG
jgi:hypothetical protein